MKSRRNISRVNFQPERKKSLATVLKKCDSPKTLPEDVSSSPEDEDASVYKPGDGMLSNEGLSMGHSFVANMIIK